MVGLQEWSKEKGQGTNHIIENSRGNQSKQNSNQKGTYKQEQVKAS
jgi:hypothetical protein